MEHQGFIKACRWIMSMVVMCMLGLLLNGGQARAAVTCGSFTVDGTAGDYSYNESTGELTVKNTNPITISGNVESTKKGFIKIESTSANITFNSLTILRYIANQTTEDPAVVISDSFTGTVNIIISGTNSLVGNGAPAIQKNGASSKLILSGSGTLKAYADNLTGQALYGAAIGGAHGKSGENITIESGTYVLTSRSGGGACLGGGFKGKGKNIIINGGNITAEYNNGMQSRKVSDRIGAAIGGGAQADGVDIIINGGTIKATGGALSSACVAGAAIGGGSNGEGDGITINGGEVTASIASKFNGAAIGSGRKDKDDAIDWTVNTKVTINGGKVTANGTNYSPGIGGCGHQDKNDSATIKITDGTVTAVNVGDSSAIGGGDYCNSYVYISGGSIKATAGTNTSTNGTMSESVGLSGVSIDKGCDDVLQDTSTAKNKVSLVPYTVASLANKKVEFSIIDTKNSNAAYTDYGMDDIYADGTGTVYLYLRDGLEVTEMHEAGLIPVDTSDLSWDYAGPYYYKNSPYEVKLTNLPAGVTVKSYSGNKQTDVSDTPYTATATLTAQAGYVLSDTTSTLKWEIKQYPATDLKLLYNGSTSIEDEYDGAVAITASGYTISDSLTGTYSDSYSIKSSGNKTLYFKRTDGGYIVTKQTGQIYVNSDAKVDFDGVTWNYSSSANYIYNGKAYKVELNLTDEQKEAVDITYVNAEKTAVGTYEASVTITPKDGYNILNLDKVVKSCEWQIKEYPYSGITLKYNDATADDSIWYGTAVKITAVGHKIRVGGSGTFADSVTIDKTGDTELYFKSTSEGEYITTTAKTVSIKLDQKKPSGTIAVDGASYNSISSSEVYCHLKTNNVAITTSDGESGVSKTEYVIYKGTEQYTTTAAIESAFAQEEWNDGTTCTLDVNATAQAVYVKITDNVGNVTYISTPVIYNDITAPTVKTAQLSDATESEISYSFTLSESSNYYYVLQDASDDMPAANISSFVEAASKTGNQGGSGVGISYSGTFRNLTPNKSYKLYVIADDGRKSLSGENNANVSEIKASDVIKTISKVVPVSDQTMYVKKETASSYTYDPWNMLRDSAKKQAENNELGIIDYEITEGTEANIISGDITTYDISANHKGINIPIGTGFNVGDKQTVTIKFKFSEPAYEEVSAILNIEAISKTPLTLDSSVRIDDKTYDGTAAEPSGTIAWYNGSTPVSITDTQIVYENLEGVAVTSPTDAGTYKMTISIPESNAEYAGTESFSFVINRKDITEKGANWSPTWYINDQEYSVDSIYYADDSMIYTATVKGYPADLLNVDYEEQSGQAVGTYHTKAVYSLKSGNPSNYIIPDASTLAWSITEKKQPKTDIDMSGITWKYYKGTSSCESDAEFFEDGTGIKYTVEIDETSLPEEIAGVSYEDNFGTVTGSHEAVATFTVTDESRYNIPEKIRLPWNISKLDENGKITPVMTGIRWIYTQGDDSGEYVPGTTELTENGAAYVLTVINLPKGVSVKGYTDNEKSVAGTYKAIVEFSVDDETQYNIPDNEEFDWEIVSDNSNPPDPKPAEDPDPKPAEDPDSGKDSGAPNQQASQSPATQSDPGASNQPVIAQVGTVATASGANYKILTATAAGGTVEYEGQEKIDKKATSLSIPASVVIDNVTYEVTAIKSGAFSGYTKLKKVSIGSKITRIGDKAFYKCTSLKSVVIPAGVTEIGKSAFEGCKNLSKITIKSKVLNKVGKNAIKGIKKKATIKCPNKKLAKSYKKKLFKKNTGYKKTMKIK